MEVVCEVRLDSFLSRILIRVVLTAVASIEAGDDASNECFGVRLVHRFQETNLHHVGDVFLSAVCPERDRPEQGLRTAEGDRGDHFARFSLRAELTLKYKF